MTATPPRRGDAAAAVIRALGLRPHPEGGHYRETWRDKPGRDKAGRDNAGDNAAGDPRGSGTAIYYLLRRGDQSRWHRIDATEVWHHYAGAALVLKIITDGGTRTLRLGTDIPAGERPQVIVPKGVWQSAQSAGAWSLVGCTVSPAFEFSGFEMAPDGVVPGRAQRAPARKRRHIVR